MKPFEPGDNVYIDAMVLRYIDNDRTAPKPYYQVLLPNGQITCVLCDQIQSRKISIIRDTDTIVDATEYKKGHYRQK